MVANVQWKMRRWEWLLLALVLSIFAAQALLSSPVKSASFDEEYHLMRGYAYLRTGDFRMSTSHPPLINLLSALPLLTRSDVTLPVEHPTWSEPNYFLFADVFMWQANDNPHELLVLARIPIIILGALLAAALFFWGRQLGGPVAGWTAVLLATFDPNLLANSRLVTTDLGLTFFLFLAAWRFWCWLERPTRGNFIFAGLAAGLTMASKFTGVMVWPIFVLVFLLHPTAREKRWLDSPFWDFVAAMTGLAGIAYLALWAVYRFDVGPVPDSGVPLPILAPFYPYSAWWAFTIIEEQPRTAYLMGQTSPRGWWYYFPVALAVKTPLPTLLLSGAGLVNVVRLNRWRALAALWLPLALFLGLTMTGRLAIGYRHILPIVPFIIMLAAYAVGGRWQQSVWPPVQRRPLLRYLLPLLLLWQVVGTVRLFPHYEAYFNEVAGGPENGDQWLVDSNLDWGQDLPALRQLMEERGIEEVNLAYFGTALPEVYGINYHPLPGFLRFVTGAEVEAYNPYTPPPGWYAISRTSLHLGLLLQNVDLYAYFQDKEPLARAGYSINLYRVEYEEDTPLRRTVVTGATVSDLSPEELGVEPDTRLIAKWSASPATEIIPAGTDIDLPANFESVEAAFGDTFTLWGYAAPENIAPGETLELQLYWRVGSADVPTPAPSTAGPLAAFVHLSGADPAHIVAQFDGWDAALTGLEPGDVIIQQISLSLPPDLPPERYYLRTGLYSPQTGRRLPIEGEAVDFITLNEVTVALP